MRCFSLAFVLLTTTTASAENKSVHVTLSGDVAATDNVLATTADRNEADLLFTVRPGVLFGYDAPRMNHDVTFEGEVIEYLSSSEAPSLSLRGGIRSSYVTSRHTTLLTSIGGSNGVITALSSRLSPEQTGPQIQPIGRVDTLSGDAATNFSYETGRSFTISQGLFARASKSDDNAVDAMNMPAPTINKSAEAGGTLNFEKSWRRGDSVSVEVGASVLRLEREAPPMAVLGPRLDRQINPRGRISWRHDFNRVWSSSLDGGVVYVHPYKDDPNNPETESKDGVFPIVGAALAYTEVWGRASAQIRRDVSPNLFLAQNTVNDSATIALAMPLPFLDDSRMRRPKFVALGSFGANRTQLINSDTSEAESTIVAYRVDAGIGYTPRPGFTYGIRYEFFYQSPDNTAVMMIPGFFRNTISFTFSIRYPDRVAGVEAQKRNTGGVRADGKDLVPIGVDPVMNTFGEQGEGGGEE